MKRSLTFSERLPSPFCLYLVLLVSLWGLTSSAVQANPSSKVSASPAVQPHPTSKTSASPPASRPAFHQEQNSPASPPTRREQAQVKAEAKENQKPSQPAPLHQEPDQATHSPSATTQAQTAPPPSGQGQTKGAKGQKGVWEVDRSRSARSLEKHLAPKKIALVIGIGDYKDPYWPRLRYARRDAQKFRNALLKLGGFHHILTLIQRKQTTASSIRRALRRLQKLNTSPWDTVVVYVSSHGTVVQADPNKPVQRYVVTSNVGSNLPQTALSVRWLRSTLEAFPSRRKALILATCYSGSPGSKSRLPRGVKGRPVLQAVRRSRTMLILSAASYQQPAFESNRLQGDVYTHFLLRCLQKLSLKQKKIQPVTATEAHSCSVRHTYRYVRKEFGHLQLPGMESRIDGLDAVYLAGPDPFTRRKGSPSLKSSVQVFSHWLQKWRVRFALEGKKSRPHRLDLVGEELVALPPGRYKVVWISRQANETRQTTVRLRPGERRILTLPRPPSLRLSYAIHGGLLGKGNELRHGVALDLRWRLDGWSLGAGLGYWTAFVPLNVTSYQSHLVDVWLDGGWSPSWGPLRFFFGLRANTGLHLQASYNPSLATRLAPLFALGLQAEVSSRLVGGLSLWLGGGPRALFVFTEDGFSLRPGWQAQAGLFYLF